MNVNLGDAGEGWSHQTIQEEIEEHIEIMRGAGQQVADRPVMLLSDPEYPGAYRVWLQLQPKSDIQRRASDPTWAWVTPDGEIIMTQRPWGVTD